MGYFQIETRSITIADVQSALKSKVKLSVKSKKQIEQNRTFLEKKMALASKPIYGINTGFGSLCDTVISNDQLSQLQRNLVISHACGLGDEVPADVVKTMLLLKIQNMVYGHSGVRLIVVERLIELYNNGIFPVVYQQGSLGASGDLAPLAHLSLPLIGEGEVYLDGVKMRSIDALNKIGIEPIVLQAKEGLALLNGTQFMAAYGVQILIKGEHLFRMANKATSVSLEGFDGLHGAFFAPLHQVRKQPFQEIVAAQVRDMIEGSEIIFRDKPQVQDPYSFRCSPQVHGASGQWIAFVKQVVENEISSVTDNPTVFEEEDLVVSGGNFHGQSMALALDSLAIALAELGSISERRTYKLISGQRGLPAFLVKNPGVNSGFMIPQYTAASIVSQNKQFCTPASIDSIDSSNGQEDHVSMGANAATKCYRVVENLEKILGIEFLNAFQAIEFRDQKSAPKIKAMQIEFRKLVPFVTDDVLMRELIIKAIEFVKL